MILLDSGQVALKYVRKITSGFPAPFPLGLGGIEGANNQIIPTFANGFLFDTSACDSWTLQGYITQVTNLASVSLYWFDDPTATSYVSNNYYNFQTIQLPNTGTGNSFFVAGRCLGPLCAVLLNPGNAGFSGRIDFSTHNRTRLYDQPYTPCALGTILANAGLTSIAAGGSGITAIPYYLGPARLAPNFNSQTAASAPLVYAAVTDDLAGAAQNQLAFASGVVGALTGLWIPALASTATTWRLVVHNGTGGALTLGASVVAA